MKNPSPIGQHPAPAESARPGTERAPPARKAEKTSSSAVSRRDFLGGAAKSAGVACLAAVALDQFIRTARSTEAKALRPPGAIDEEEFLSACVRCGLCVRACPYDTLHLATLGDSAAIGTPYFVARETPCFMCHDVPCAKACPTGALNAEIPNIRHADMGLAVLVDHETCLNYKGMHCSICYRVCPIRNEAITLEKQTIKGRQMVIPVVHSTKCTGCGHCEKHCVLEEAAIRVLPRPLGQGKAGRNNAGRGLTGHGSLKRGV
ncbi:methylamine utilization protein MauM [Hyphomicrobium nitrativorans NL23]|uniref:Methylamine utilization protein MauM n=1 Tax=Hyphomicrobium nitrativorans NL23 TaxID=1029756 RepID=V5SAS5_9HYPH|nr:ferredoxin-type protein NapG [Hyphomicrobium nitrativorans]AHB47537.1 methylamine utilization protein MauM [Hyphomicrobium nitrativorans NL23]